MREQHIAPSALGRVSLKLATAILLAAGLASCAATSPAPEPENRTAAQQAQSSASQSGAAADSQRSETADRADRADRADHGSGDDAPQYSFEGWDQGTPDRTVVEAPAGSDADAAGQAPAATAAPEIRPTVVSYPEPDDPLIGFNRVMFGFNDYAYRYVGVPLAIGYDKITPKPVRTGIGNFFSNLRAPISLVNNAAQFKGKRAGRNLLRFTINSTLGLAGIFDPAEDWFNIEESPAGFGDTLRTWGVGAGPYVVLPLLGPSDLRGTAGYVGNAFLNPVPYVVDSPESFAIVSAGSFDDATPTLLKYTLIRQETEDPYVFFRNLYVQGRERDAEYGPGLFSVQSVGDSSDVPTRSSADQSSADTSSAD